MELLTLREIQLAELNILKEFDRICRANNLKYTLSSGTLIGAVRHKGFIPWDDDVDVNMPRPDYEKFIEIFNANIDTERYILTDDRKKGAEYPFIKILDRHYPLAERGFKEVGYVWLDIFPVDGFADSEKKQLKSVKKSRFYKHVIIVRKYKTSKDYSGRHSKFKFLLGKAFAKMYTPDRAIKKAYKNATKYPYETANYAGVICWSNAGITEKIEKPVFENLVELEFEGSLFYCVAEWDRYLTNIYGDYMTPPPEDKRKIHGIAAYRAE